MNYKFNYKELPFLLMVFYPVADITYNTFVSELHLTTFNSIYFTLLIVLSFAFYKYLINKMVLACLVLFALYLLSEYSKSGSVTIQFFLFLLTVSIFSSKEYLNKLKKYIDKNNILIIIISITYILFLLYSIFFKDGIKTGWNTRVVYGPFELPHTLAYELLVLLMLVLYKCKQGKKIMWILFAAVFEMFILLTCVRSALLASAVILFSFFWSYNFTTKVYLTIIAGILIGVFMYYRVFDYVIEKSLYATGNGSITNGRDLIASKSLITFFEATDIEKLFGSGYNNLLNDNLRLLGLQIQAHNDLVTVLVSFGIVGLAAYLYYLISYFKGKGWLLLALAMFILFYFNGLFLYWTMVMGLGIARIFFEMTERSVKKELRGANKQ